MTQAEREVRKIIYKDDFFRQYADIVPEVGVRLEDYVFDFVDALQRAERRAYRKGYKNGKDSILVNLP